MSQRNIQFNTPILFLVFNQPDITMITFEEIKKIKPKQLFISADGPRINNKKDKKECLEVRDLILDKVDWDCDIKTRFLDTNMGCKKAVSSGITWFFSHVDKGIILEYDCLPSRSFFGFCEKMLSKYESNPKVMSITGTNHIGYKNITDDSYFFSRIPSIWGWATWKDAWVKWDSDCLNHKLILDNINIHFQNNDHKFFWTKKLKKVKLEMDKTWGHPLVFSFFLNDGLCVTPKKNLITNIGFSENATNATYTDDLNSNLKRYELKINETNINICANHKYDSLYTESLMKSEPKILREYIISTLFRFMPLSIVSKIRNIYKFMKSENEN
jgi:hypothetical protein